MEGRSPTERPGASEPRKHHYVPAFYLAGFTEEGSQDGRLRAIAKSDGRIFGGTPRTLAHQRDLYRVEHQDLEPNAIEYAFSQVEGQVAPVLGRLIESSISVDPNDVALVLNLVAMLSIRVPAVRKLFASVIEDVGKQFANDLLQDPDKYERFLESQRELGMDTSDYPTLKKMREGWESGGLSLEANQTWLTSQGLKVSPEIYDLLAKRSWMIATCDPTETGPLITSDRPVSISWTRGDVPAFYSPGFAMPDTEVTFPLGRRHALIGRWEDQPSQRDIGREGVAMLNGLTCLAADQHVYSVSEDFFALDRDQTVITGQSFIERHGP